MRKLFFCLLAIPLWALLSAAIGGPEATAQSRQQKIVVRGTVVDPDGQPAVGAGILEEGTTHGVETDLDGRFSMETTVGTTLVVSWIYQII